MDADRTALLEREPDQVVCTADLARAHVPGVLAGRL